ncbi:MAG: hypothetical protein ACREQV_13940, partial [Candidatus Binatia bacterium]
MHNNLSRATRWWLIAALTAATFLPRLIGLGNVLTVDEPLWQSRAGQFIRALSVGQFEETLVAGQPGITTAWLAGIVDHYHSLAASQAVIAVATGLLVLIITYFLVYLWGWRWAVTAGFLLALNPFLLGHSRVVHTDALLALFYLASLCALLAGLLPVQKTKSPIRRYIVVSAVLAAFALLTKLFALLIIPTALLIIGWSYIRQYV